MLLYNYEYKATMLCSINLYINPLTSTEQATPMTVCLARMSNTSGASAVRDGQPDFAIHTECWPPWPSEDMVKQRQ
eukprot:scaffold138532_cov19-Prasinocladus_malaysianus.AAC.1